MLTNIHIFFCSQLSSSKNREEGANGRKSNDEIKDELLMVKLNLGLENVRNCEKTTKKGRNVSSTWRINKDFYMKNSKSLISLKKCVRKKWCK